MHELSIALSIVDLAEQEVKKANRQRVESIDLEIGKLSGVEVDSLEFLWEQAVKNSVLQGAIRNIHRVPGKARCMDCGTEFEIEALFDACPACGQYLSETIQGKELKVKSLTII